MIRNKYEFLIAAVLILALLHLDKTSVEVAAINFSSIMGILKSSWLLAIIIGKFAPKCKHKWYKSCEISIELNKNNHWRSRDDEYKIETKDINASLENKDIRHFLKNLQRIK